MSEPTVNKSKAKLNAFLMPIMLVVLITIVISSLTLTFYANPITPEDPQDGSPFPEKPEDPGGIAFGAILTMIFYVGLVFISGFLVLLIIRKGLLQLLGYFFAVIMGLSWFTFTLYYGSISLFHLADFLNTNWGSIPSLLQDFFIVVFDWEVPLIPVKVSVVEFFLYLFSVILGFLGTYSFGIQTFDKIWIRNTMMILFGPMIGTFLAIHFGLLTVFLILIGLSLYDIYAVFRGPLKGIIDESRESAQLVEEKLQNDEININEVQIAPLMPALPVYSTPLINIGLGDFAFFSVLISAAVIISFELVTPFPLLLAIIGLFGGAYYTFQFLKEDRALPGLPLPIFGGIGFLIFGVITSMILGGVTLESIIGLFG
ncbi:MAG: hypothetical protein ACXACP_12320 [Candidatus Hodarchaeales archaeon]|jgi:hypothetical protein